MSPHPLPSSPVPGPHHQAAILEKKSREVELFSHTLQAWSSQKKDKISFPLKKNQRNSLRHLAIIGMIVKNISRAALKYCQNDSKYGNRAGMTQELETGKEDWNGAKAKASIPWGVFAGLLGIHPQ